MCRVASLRIRRPGHFDVYGGLSGDMPRSFKAGGILSLMTSAILLLKAWQASRRSYKHTELWLMLPPHDRPHSAIAQQSHRHGAARDLPSISRSMQHLRPRCCWASALVYAQLFSGVLIPACAASICSGRERLANMLMDACERRKR